MNKVMLVCAIVTTIVYVCFDVWNIFIRKKKTKITILDMVYCMFLGMLVGKFQIKVVLVIGITLAIWLVLISKKCDKNLKEKNKKIFSSKNES